MRWAWSWLLWFRSERNVRWALVPCGGDQRERVRLEGGRLNIGARRVVLAAQRERVRRHGQGAAFRQPRVQAQGVEKPLVRLLCGHGKPGGCPVRAGRNADGPGGGGGRHAAGGGRGAG